ncbi:MAG: hypothetical protein KBE04_05755 [Phycisphaerae bacterium]|nr:hypothetical protein [Phycisphaerae bacterium]
MTKGCWIAVGVVSLWCVLACAYLGVEDGSSGLSPLGWAAGLFFVPGGIALQVFKGSHSNADLPLMAGISWIAYGILAIGVLFAWRAVARRRSSSRGKPQ